MADHEGREIEIKWGIDAGGYARLQDRLDATLSRLGDYEQVNRFFDTADGRLAGSGRSIRLRTTGQRLVLTCKHRTAPIGDWHDHREFEIHLNPTCCPDIRLTDGRQLARQLPLPQDFRRLIGGAGLVGLGGFSNRRRSYHYDHGEIALDRTCYPDGQIDYELEIETDRPVASIRTWRERLRSWSIDWQLQRHSKLERFIQRASSPVAEAPRPRARPGV